MSNDKKQARLEEWFVGPNDMLFGKVYGHDKFTDGEEIITSRVVSWDAEKKQATTRNTNYVLGTPLGASFKDIVEEVMVRHEGVLKRLKDDGD